MKTCEVCCKTIKTDNNLCAKCRAKSEYVPKKTNCISCGKSCTRKNEYGTGHLCSMCHFKKVQSYKYANVPEFRCKCNEESLKRYHKTKELNKKNNFGTVL